MQISEARVFVFVEGKSDRYFYDKICESLLGANGISYEICLGQELPEKTGGKSALLRFFQFLDSKRSLLNNFRGKSTGAMFFLDKDVDDFLATSVSSDHLAYTEGYSVENYFFSDGDLSETLAAAAALTLAAAKAELGHSNGAWRHRAAASWKDWVKLCLFCRIRNINYDCNYSVYSRIHTGPYVPMDGLEYTRRLIELERRSGLTPIGFKRVFNKISRMVDEVYDRSEFDKVFPGKWYAVFLAEDARRIAGGGPYNSIGLPERLLTALQMTLDFNQPWTNHLKRPLQALVRQL